MIHPDQILGVILQVGHIPVGSVVTKITGEKEYIVRDEIKICADESVSKGPVPYAWLRSPDKAPLEDRVRFLVAKDDSTSIVAVAATKLVKWRMPAGKLARFLVETMDIRE